MIIEGIQLEASHYILNESNSDSIWEKLKSFFKKIWTFVKNVITKIKNFFSKLFGRSKSIEAEAKEVSNKAKKAETVVKQQPTTSKSSSSPKKASTPASSNSKPSKNDKPSSKPVQKSRKSHPTKVGPNAPFAPKKTSDPYAPNPGKFTPNNPITKKKDIGGHNFSKNTKFKQFNHNKFGWINGKLFINKELKPGVAALFGLTNDTPLFEKALTMKDLGNADLQMLKINLHQVDNITNKDSKYTNNHHIYLGKLDTYIKQMNRIESILKRNLPMLITFLQDLKKNCEKGIRAVDGKNQEASKQLKEHVDEINKTSNIAIKVNTKIASIVVQAQNSFKSIIKEAKGYLKSLLGSKDFDRSSL